MLTTALIVLALTGASRGSGDNSSHSARLSREQAVQVSSLRRQLSQEQVSSLRRQLMRDNYDYQQSGDERRPSRADAARSAHHSKLYNQNGGLPPSSEVTPANINSFSAEHGQREQYGRGQRAQGRPQHQRGQHDPPGQYGQRRRRKQGHPPQQYSDNQDRPQVEQGPRDQPNQYRQRGSREQTEQFEQLGPNEQLGHYEQRGALEQPATYNRQRGLQQRGQYKQRQRQKEIGGYPERGQYDQRELDELQARPARSDERRDPAVQRADRPDWPAERYDKRHETYEAPLRRPFGDLRGNQRVQEEQAENDPRSPEQELSPDDKEAFDRQEMSGSEDEDSDYSERQKYTNAGQYEIRAQDGTHDTPPPRALPPLTYREGEAPPPAPYPAPLEQNISENDLLYYADDTQLRRRNNDMSPDVPESDEDQSSDDKLSSRQPNAISRNSTAGVHSHSVVSPHSSVSKRPGPVRTRPSPGSSRAGHKNSHTSPSGSRLRAVSSRASFTSSRASSTSSRAKHSSASSKLARQPATTKRPGVARTEHPRSFVVTVSENNVTYKILTLRSGEGRRGRERRLVEERGPGSVALISLDRVPVPALRLPRARRQYMHDHHHHHRHSA